MIPALLAQIGLPILTSIVGSALEKVDTPATKAASKALGKIEFSSVPSETLEEANRHAETMAKIELDSEAAKIAEINKSLRKEVESQDMYVRRMRPTFGYLMAITWAAQMLGVAYIIAFEPARAGEVLQAMSSLSAIWAVGLSVLGIYVYKRSEDKKR